MPEPSPVEKDESREAQKQAIYDLLSPRRRAFIQRIGYDVWDPFQEPNNPREPRTDKGKRTTQQLVREYLHTLPDGCSNIYAQGVLRCALGLINDDESVRGAYEFSIWYHNLLREEGHET